MDPYKRRQIKSRVKRKQSKYDTIPFRNKDIDRIDSLRKIKNERIKRNSIVKDVQMEDSTGNKKMINKPAKN